MREVERAWRAKVPSLPSLSLSSLSLPSHAHLASRSMPMSYDVSRSCKREGESDVKKS